jgi:putative ABC transport system ATP-binding protein
MTTIPDVMQHPPTVLELRNVTKEYPGTPPVIALAGVDVAVAAGEFTAIVGPSGSGKSTLLNLVGALDRPTTGEVLIDGTEISSVSDAALSAVRGRRIGFVFQSFNLLDGLDAIENVAVGLMYDAVPRRERRRRSLEALERVGLGHRADHRPSRLSGGERQRVAIARAIVTEPALLLADEPTGNLDTRTGGVIMEQFHELHREGATVVLITHDAELASHLPRQVTLRDGSIVDDRRRAA